MTSVQLAPAYVLHARPFKETSLLLDVLTCEHGRISLVAKGAKRAKSGKSALLQPFSPVVLGWSGRSDLQTLTQVESRGNAQRFMGRVLLCGLYVNELLVKLLHRHDPCPVLFKSYEHLLERLPCADNLEICLRSFELNLLKELGYALSAAHLEAGAYYIFTDDNGFIKVNGHSNRMDCFSGESLLAILSNSVISLENLPTAKRLMRAVLHVLLQGKPLNARALFIEGVE